MTAASEAEGSGAQKTNSDRLDPWFEDGNIVLCVEGKYFRIHRGILSAYSEVFKDMFESCQPNEGEKSELIEQCPVIHIHDAVADVQMVLKAMYDRSYPLPYYERAPLSVVSVFLRLGEKYNVERLVHEAKARLCCAFESTLSVAAKISSSNYGTLSLFPGISGNDPHNFLAMNLLEEMDLRASLPLAMYQCAVACPSVTAVIDGYKFNGTVCALSPANLRSWMLIKGILENFRIRLAQSLRVSNGCVVQSSCALHVRRLWADDTTVGQPFGPWKHEWDKLFCDACRLDLNMWRNGAIQKAWNQIPAAFGFDTWAEVAKSGDFPSLT